MFLDMLLLTKRRLLPVVQLAMKRELPYMVITHPTLSEGLVFCFRVCLREVERSEGEVDE